MNSDQFLKQSSHWQLDQYGVLNKLLFNEIIPETPEGVFRLLGFVHLYSASGIHIYAMMDAFDRIGLWLGRVFGRQTLSGRFTFRTAWVKQFCFCFGLITLLLIWKLQGFRLGFARPILIYLLRSLAKNRGFRFKILYPVGITLILDLFFGNEAGRLHYYLAVGGGLLALDYAKKIKKPFLEHPAMAIGSWVPIAIYDLWNHHFLSLMTPIWSLITLPVISLVLFPLTLANVAFSFIAFSSISVSQSIIQLWQWFLDFCIGWVDRGFTFWFISEAKMQCSLLLAAIGFMNPYIIKSKLLRLGSIITLCLVAVCFRFTPFDFLKNDRIVQLNVKQGDSFLIARDGRHEMIDIGGGRAWKPSDWMLKFSEQGVGSIDTLLLSHLDEDHCGGLKNLISWIPIKTIETNSRLWISPRGIELESIIEQKSPSTQICNSNCIKLFQVGWFESRKARGNGKRKRKNKKSSEGNKIMAGVVVPLSDREAYFALGDGDIRQEKLYLSHFHDQIEEFQERIWKVGHHGSRYSSGFDLIQTLRPNRAWISVGKRNPYHHPHPFTLERYQKLKIPIYRTDEVGDLIEYISHPLFSSNS